MVKRNARVQNGVEIHLSVEMREICSVVAVLCIPFSQSVLHIHLWYSY